MPQASPLIHTAFDPQQFKQEGKQLLDLLSQHLQQSLEGKQTPVLNWTPPNALKENWPDGPLWETVLQHSIRLHHPHYVGHQVNPPLPIAALAGLFSDLMNNGMAVYEMGAGATVLEQQVVETATKAIGYSDQAGGLLTSGGTLSNLTALLTARSQVAPVPVWETGNQEHRFALMVSEQAHYCIDRAVRIMGWGSEGIIKIPTDDRFSMRTDLLESALEKARKEGRTVLAVVGSACSTATGSYDDLEAIGQFCQQHQLWFHVDGAHGAAVIFSPNYRHLVKGIEQADSVTLDFHKMLLAPTITTGLFFKNGLHSFSTFAQQADYLWQEQEETEWFNVGKRSFECTKTMMSLKVMSIIHQYGLQLWEDYVTYCYDLAREFAQLLKKRPNWQLAIEPQSNIVCFRHTPEALPADQWTTHNLQLRQRALEKGRFYLVQTRLKGEVYLRTTLVNPFTTLEVLEELLQYLEKKN